MTNEEMLERADLKLEKAKKLMKQALVALSEDEMLRLENEALVFLDEAHFLNHEVWKSHPDILEATKAKKRRDKIWTLYTNLRDK